MLFSVQGSLTATHFPPNVWCRHFTPRTNLENPSTTVDAKIIMQATTMSVVNGYQSAMRGQ